MSSVEIQLVDAVIAWLGGAEYSKHAEFTRTYTPEAVLDDGNTVLVQLTPVKRERTVAARDGVQDNHIVVSIVISGKLTSAEVADPTAAMDLWMLYRQELEDRLSLEASPGLEGFEFVSIETDPIYAADHLKQNGQFTAVILATFRTLTGV